MKHLINRIWDEDEGVLTFEWVLLVTLLTIGVVSGLAAARDAVFDELGDVAQACCVAHFLRRRPDSDRHKEPVIKGETK